MLRIRKKMRRIFHSVRPTNISKAMMNKKSPGAILFFPPSIAPPWRVLRHNNVLLVEHSKYSGASISLEGISSGSVYVF